MSKETAAWAEDWIMDHLCGEEGRLPTRDSWLNLLKSGNLVQCDKIHNFIVDLEDEELKNESIESFKEGLLKVGVKPAKVDEIIHSITSRP